jgi:hypothetical protein
MSRFKSRRPLFAALSVVGICGLFTAFAMPFLPNINALVLALVVATASGIAICAHMRQGFRESVADDSLASELENARLMGSRWLLVGVLGLLFFLWGFGTVAYLLAGTYTRVFGTAQTQAFTVTRSTMNPRRKYGLCYETRFREHLDVFQGWRSICLRTHVQAGETIILSGYSTWLGMYVDGARQGVTGNESPWRGDAAQ